MKWMLMLALPVVFVLAGCGGPCGKGMKPDDRPVEGLLAEIGTPTGSTMCVDEVDPAGQPQTNRGFAFPAGAGDQAIEAWRTLLESKGYTESTEPDQVIENAEAAGNPKKCAVKHTFSHESKPELELRIGVCRDPVWSTITVH